MAISSTPRATGLRANSLSFVEVLAQPIALIAPTFAPAVSIPIVYASAGNATWLVFVIATIGYFFVSLNIRHFARRSAAPGALYLYVAKGLGSTAGILCGWALTLAYVVVAASIVASFSHYASLVFGTFDMRPPSIVFYAACTAIVWYYAYTDIQLSAVLMLVLEIVSIGFIAILGIIVLAKNGFALDMAQLTLTDVTPTGFSAGMVLGVFSYVGFESAITLGSEAKNPFRSIPRSVMTSAMLAGLFFIFMAYVEVLGFRGHATPLGESTTPLNTLATFSGVELLGVGLEVGIMCSFLSCVLASINAAARIAFSLARHSFYPAPLGEVHPENETPHVAVSLCVTVVFLLSASMSLFGLDDMEVFGYLSTLATYGFICAYIMVSIAAPVYLSRRGELTQRDLVVSLLAGFVMLIPVAGSFYPVPPFPYNIFPYLFLLYLGVGAWLFSTFSTHSPQFLEDVERNTIDDGNA